MLFSRLICLNGILYDFKMDTGAAVSIQLCHKDDVISITYTADDKVIMKDLYTL